MSSQVPFAVHVETSFEAEHRLDADGSPAAAHRHCWRVTVAASSDRLDRIAIVVDFRKLRQQTDDLVGRLAGTVLEDNPLLSEHDATPLGVAGWLRAELATLAEGEDYAIESVTVGCDPGIDFTLGAKRA